MRLSYILGFFLALSLPAVAAETDLKQDLTKLASAYSECINKKDPACVAALYASGGVLVNAAGMQVDIAKYHEGAFKAGFDHNEITDQVWPLGADTALIEAFSGVIDVLQTGSSVAVPPWNAP